MTVELDQQGSNKVQITASPQVAPHKCINCGFSGMAENRYFIDFGVDIEYYGTLLLCSDCFGETANILGWITPKRASAYSEVIDRLTDEVVALRTIEDLYDTIVAAVRPVLGFHDTINNLPPDADSDDENSDDEQGQSDSDTAALLTRPTELTFSEGSSDLLGSAESILDL